MSAVILHIAGFILLTSPARHWIYAGDPVIAGLFDLALPFVGYTFIAHPFGFWRDFEPETIRLCVLLTIAYWFIYLPAFYYLTIFRFFRN